jgi:hypothetical protein
MNERRVNPKISGFTPQETPRCCVRCQTEKGGTSTSPLDRLVKLAKSRTVIPPPISFQIAVFAKQSMPNDGIQTYLISAWEGPHARFLREVYFCHGECKSEIYALTLVGVDLEHPLYSVFESVGPVEVEIAEVTRKQSAHCHYQQGTPAYQVVTYLRSMSSQIGYRRLD